MKISVRLYFFLQLFLVFAAAMIGDNVAESLFLSHYDAQLLAQLYPINGIILFVFSLFTMSFIDHFNRAKLFVAFLLLLITTIIAASLLLFTGITAVVVPLYSLAYVSKILLFYFVWTLANDSMTAREGARDFPIIAAGGTIGAILTTFAIPSVLTIFDHSFLLFLWIFFLVLTVVLTVHILQIFSPFFVRRRFARHISVSPVSLFKNLEILKKEPLIATVALIYFILFFLIYVQQFHYYTVLQETFLDADSLSRFLGYFNGISLLITLLLQTCFAKRLTRKWGTVRMLFLLPFVLIMGFIVTEYGMLSQGKLVFGMVVFGVILRIACMDSFFSPNYQNFFTTLSDSSRGRAKLAIDGVVKPASMFAASLWIAGVTMGAWNIGALILIGTVSLVFLSKVKRRYLESLISFLSLYHRRNKESSRIQEVKLFETMEGREKLNNLFDSKNEILHEYAIDILADLRSLQAAEELIRRFYMAQEIPMQCAIIQALGRTGRSFISPFLYKTLNNETFSPQVRGEVVSAIGVLKVVEANIIAPFLLSTNPHICSRAIVVLRNHGNIDEAQTFHFLEQMLLHNDQSFQMESLWAISQIPQMPAFETTLRHFWYRNIISLIHSVELWSLYLAAIEYYHDWTLLVEILDSYPALSERGKRACSLLIARLVDFGEHERLLKLQSTVSFSAYSAILEGVARASSVYEKVSLEDRKNLVRYALQERDLALIAQNGVEFLQNNSTRKSSELCVKILEEENAIHFHNVLWISVILDQTGELATIIERFDSTRQEVRSRILEFVDTVGDPDVVLLIHSLFEYEGGSMVTFSSLAELTSYFEKSVIPLTAISAQYLREEEIYAPD